MLSAKRGNAERLGGAHCKYPLAVVFRWSSRRVQGYVSAKSVFTALSVIGQGAGSRAPDTSARNPFEVPGGARRRRAGKLLDFLFMASQSDLVQTRQNLHPNVIQP